MKREKMKSKKEKDVTFVYVSLYIIHGVNLSRNALV